MLLYIYFEPSNILDEILRDVKSIQTPCATTYGSKKERRYIGRVRCSGLGYIGRLRSVDVYIFHANNQLRSAIPVRVGFDYDVPQPLCT